MNAAKWSLQLKSFIPSLLVFIVTFAGYLATPRSSQVYSDPRWSIHIALSMIREGNLNLDEYIEMITPDDYAIQTIQGHKYSFFPIGTPLLAVPFVFVYNLVNSNTFMLIGRIHPVAQEVVASFITGLTAVVIYLIARLSLTVKQSLFVSFIFAFCTSAWSTASRALWQHGPSMLFLSLALYLLLQARNRPWLVQFSSIPLAYSFVIRPTNALAIFFLTGFVFLYHRKYFAKYFLWSLVIALPFFLINYSIYGTFLSPYVFPFFHSTSIGIDKFLIPSVSQLLGTLVSPSRGLFIYSPLFLFSFLGIYLKLKDFRRNYPGNMLDVMLIATLVGHYLLISTFWHWWGGYSIGPRLFSDMIPFFIYFLIPVIPIVASSAKSLFPLRLAFYFSLLVSFAIQFNTSASDLAYAWNNVPTPIDIDQGRLWDWGDPQFLRGFTLYHNIFPPGLGTDPAEINLYCKVGDDESQCKTSIELFVRPWQAFNWEANAPQGVKVVPARGQDFFKRPRLAIRLTDLDYLPGVYNLGELKIAAIEKEGAQLSRTKTVPIILHLEPGSQP